MSVRLLFWPIPLFYKPFNVASQLEFTFHLASHRQLAQRRAQAGHGVLTTANLFN